MNSKGSAEFPLMCTSSTLQAQTPESVLLSHQTKSSFPVILYYLLEKAHADGLTDIVSWTSDGKAFRVRNKDRFVAELLPRYFSQTQYGSFQRQLNLYDFKRYNRDNFDWGAHYHPLFVRGRVDMCFEMRRSPRAKKGGPAKSMEENEHRKSYSSENTNHGAELPVTDNQNMFREAACPLSQPSSQVILASPGAEIAPQPMNLPFSTVHNRNIAAPPDLQSNPISQHSKPLSMEVFSAQIPRACDTSLLPNLPYPVNRLPRQTGGPLEATRKSQESPAQAWDEFDQQIAVLDLDVGDYNLCSLSTDVDVGINGSLARTRGRVMGHSKEELLF